HPLPPPTNRPGRAGAGSAREVGATHQGSGSDGAAVPVSPPPAAGVREAGVRRSEERGGGIPSGRSPHGLPPQSVGRQPRATASVSPADRKPRSCDHLSRAIPRLFRLRGLRLRYAKDDATWGAAVRGV